MDPTGLDFGAISALLGGAGFFTGILVAGITFFSPLRPSWVPWLASIILGPLITFALAKSSGIVFVEATYYQCLFVGLMGGSAAAGQAQMSRKGDEIRADQQAQAYGLTVKPAEAPAMAQSEQPVVKP